MHKTRISFFLILALLICFVHSMCDAVSETITINAPINGSTISGVSILFSGTSSATNATIDFMLNNTLVAKITSDGSGNWSFTYNDLPDGSYICTVKILDASFSTLASDSCSFTVVNPPRIAITHPAQDDIISTLLPAKIQGTSSVASGYVQLYMDTIFTNTVSTDIYGNWQSCYPALENEEHTLFAELLTAAPLEVVADTSVTFTSSNPVTFASSISLIKLLQGRVPTTGSGSGPGFTYSVSGSIITILFSPSFSSTPYVIATGHRTSGTSTVTVTSVTTSSASIAFSTGTQQVSFQATLLQ